MTLLFVGRLPRYFDERDLEELFEGYGIYRNCKVRRGNRFGYGFIEFKEYEDALYAIRRKNGFFVQGARIVVELARSTCWDHNKCYNCGEVGHYSNSCTRKDCRRYTTSYRKRSLSPYQRRTHGHRGRSRSRRRYRRSRSRDSSTRRYSNTSRSSYYNRNNSDNDDIHSNSSSDYDRRRRSGSRESKSSDKYEEHSQSSYKWKPHYNERTPSYEKSPDHKDHAHSDKSPHHSNSPRNRRSSHRYSAR